MFYNSNMFYYSNMFNYSSIAIYATYGYVNDGCLSMWYRMQGNEQRSKDIRQILILIAESVTKLYNWYREYVKAVNCRKQLSGWRV